MGLRVGIVGVNFGVMLGLAALLGLEVFGQLAALWGAALVAGTLVSLGGPVILLRVLTDGRGLRAIDILKVAVLYPGALALIVWSGAALIWPDMPWLAILGVGFCVNLLGCLGSVMRALGSVHASMALRDAGPQVGLGLAALATPTAGVAGVLLLCAAVLLLFALGSLFWVAPRMFGTQVLACTYRPYLSLSLWATSVTGMVVAQIDLILGGAVISGEALGVYALLRRIANLVALPVSVATWVSGPAVSAANGAGDMTALARASAHSSQIAMLPGLVLFGGALLALPVLPFVFPQTAGAVPGMIFVVLLLGALGQVVLASSFTVATLCGLPRFAVAARLLMTGLYLGWFAWWGAELTALANALGYAGALSLGGLALWWAVRRKLGIDTSATVLRRAKEGQWKTS
ncbi:lipopolysaccharide biosynthesis protein [Yoonia algicola]|uniref:O-antigen/teichoic acid export membrane protein n=1 Tax=Yoonia algicola TaxID=3137368 RepID=A0AAN0LZN4_9RHOB